MMLRGHPFMARINKAILNNRVKLNEIQAKYNMLIAKYDKCSHNKKFQPLSELSKKQFIQCDNKNSAK